VSSSLDVQTQGRTGGIAARLYVDSGLVGFRVVTTESDGEAVDSRLTIRIERRGVRRYRCSGVVAAESQCIGARIAHGTSAVGVASTSRW